MNLHTEVIEASYLVKDGDLEAGYIHWTPKRGDDGTILRWGWVFSIDSAYLYNTFYIMLPLHEEMQHRLSNIVYFNTLEEALEAMKTRIKEIIQEASNQVTKDSNSGSKHRFS